MNEVEVFVEAEINPTEDSDKVKKAIENIIWSGSFQSKHQKRGSLLLTKTKGVDSLSKIYNLFRRERKVDAARSMLLKGLSEKSIIFYLNKQAAYVGHLSFSEPSSESPLGPIKVQIQCNNPLDLIEWLAPKTSSNKKSKR